MNLNVFSSYYKFWGILYFYVKKFWTRREGGAKNFRLDLFFWIPEIQCFLMFLWVLGYFQFLGQRGGENFRTRREGGRKISDASLGGGAKNFRPSKFSESLGKIKGHVKNLLRK